MDLLTRLCGDVVSFHVAMIDAGIKVYSSSSFAKHVHVNAGVWRTQRYVVVNVSKTVCSLLRKGTVVLDVYVAISSVCIICHLKVMVCSVILVYLFQLTSSSSPSPPHQLSPLFSLVLSSINQCPVHSLGLAHARPTLVKRCPPRSIYIYIYIVRHSVSAPTF